jgi:hypothetical protein
MSNEERVKTYQDTANLLGLARDNVDATGHRQGLGGIGRCDDRV